MKRQRFGAPKPGNDNAPSKGSAAWELGKLWAVPARAKGRTSLRKTIVLLALAVGFTAPASAQPMTGMAALQYYVGTWSCMAGPIGNPMRTDHSLSGSLKKRLEARSTIRAARSSS